MHFKRATEPHTLLFDKEKLLLLNDLNSQQKLLFQSMQEWGYLEKHLILPVTNDSCPM